MANKLKYLKYAPQTKVANWVRKALSKLITLTLLFAILAPLSPLVPPLAQLLVLQTVANANRTLKNLKTIETRTKNLSKSTVCAQVSSMTQYSMRRW
jgi:hypothetical protein